MKKIKGGVTAPKGFAAMGLKAGIKKDRVKRKSKTVFSEYDSSST